MFKQRKKIFSDKSIPSQEDKKKQKEIFKFKLKEIKKMKKEIKKYKKKIPILESENFKLLYNLEPYSLKVNRILATYYQQRNFLINLPSFIQQTNLLQEKLKEIESVLADIYKNLSYQTALKECEYKNLLQEIELKKIEFIPKWKYSEDNLYKYEKIQTNDNIKLYKHKKLFTVNTETYTIASHGENTLNFVKAIPICKTIKYD